MSAEDELDAEREGSAETHAEKKPARARKAPAAKAQEPDGEQAAGRESGAEESAAQPAAAKPAAKKAAAKKAAAKKPAAKKAAAKAPAAGAPAEEPATKKPAAAKPAKRAKKAAEGDAEQAAPVEQKAVAAKPKAGPRRAQVQAHARYVRTSARKARMVCGHLRGKSVQEARAILAFTPREAARDWSKLLESAVANAENNHELLEDDLIVREAYADEGPTIKRFRPRAMGRAAPIRKRTSHLTITLSPRP
jgi:ribosomal protein L22